MQCTRSRAAAGLGLALGWACAGSVAHGQILDSFASNQNFLAGKYTFVPVFNNPGNDPQVTGGELRIDTFNGSDTFATSAFLWNQGQQLQDVGDVASIRVRLDGGPISAGSVHVGLYLSDTLGPGGVSKEVNMGRTSGNTYLMQVVGVSSTPLDGTPVGNSLLSVEVTGAGGDSLDLLVSLDGTGFTTVSQAFSMSAAALYFGPIAFDTDGANGAHDDLGFDPATTSPGPCPWDLDRNGAVDTVDFLDLLALWATDPGGPPDFDGNGLVDTVDFLELLAHWGPCPVTAGCGPGSGGCCFANGTAGCEDASCCGLVCQSDPFCCDTDWDGQCAAAAQAMCSCPTGSCSPGAGSCCSANGSAGCDDPDCCMDVCAVDPFCCDTDWDGQCAETALGSAACSCSKAPCGPGAGSCCVANGSPGCEDLACCQAICAADPFCCDTDWDGLCADAAQSQCDCP